MSSCESIRKFGSILHDRAYCWLTQFRIIYLFLHHMIEGISISLPRFIWLVVMDLEKSLLMMNIVCFMLSTLEMQFCALVKLKNTI
jgi:hypothetical protein